MWCSKLSSAEASRGWRDEQDRSFHARRNRSLRSRRLHQDKLEVYQASLAFIVWLESILVALIKASAKCRLHDRSLGNRSD
jgi:hypothetical protein